MKHLRPAVHAAAPVVTRKGKPVHCVVTDKTAAIPADKAAANDDERLEMIRQTAYSFYEARNHEGGHALDDWLRAEEQVNQMPTARQPVRAEER